MNLTHIINFKVQVYSIVTNLTFILPTLKIIHPIYILCSISCQIKHTITKEKRFNGLNVTINFLVTVDKETTNLCQRHFAP